MNSKQGVKPRVKLLVAEDLRQEAMGKFSLLGILPGERFLVGGPAPILPPGFPSVAFMIPSLAFVFIISGLEGKLTGKFSILAPDGKSEAGSSEMVPTVAAQKNSPTIAFAIARPFAGPTFGEYTIRLDIGKHKWRFPLVVEKAPDPTQTPAKPGKARAARRSAPTGG
jgi:hypothetical protein